MCFGFFWRYEKFDLPNRKFFFAILKITNFRFLWDIFYDVSKKLNCLIIFSELMKDGTFFMKNTFFLGTCDGFLQFFWFIFFWTYHKFDLQKSEFLPFIVKNINFRFLWNIFYDVANKLNRSIIFSAMMKVGIFFIKNTFNHILNSLDVMVFCWFFVLYFLITCT